MTMKYLWVGMGFILCLFLQSSVTTLPLFLLFFLLLYIYYRQEWVFFAACLAGILLDIFSVRIVGVSSIFFLCFLFCVFLYQRKFEIGSSFFVFLALFFGSVLYCLLFSVSHASLIGVVMGGGGWLLFISLGRRIWFR